MTVIGKYCTIAVTMGFKIDCPNCGARDYTEFAFDAELRPDPFNQRIVGSDLWARANAAGPQAELWFHSNGCRRWITVHRDTRTNEIDADI